MSDTNTTPQAEPSMDKRIREFKLEGLATHRESIGAGNELVKLLEDGVDQMKSSHARIQNMSTAFFIFGLLVMGLGVYMALFGGKEASGAFLGVGGGPISTPFMVNAAGPWAGVLGLMAGVDIPITPIRRQMLTTTPMPEIPPDFPFVIDFAQSLYFHREGMGLLTGMSNPNQKPGFDQNVDLDWELVHLETASSRLPVLESAGLASRWAGLYEVTPDAHPIFGITPVSGFYVCAGFSGHGFMHGPISGRLMAEIILEGHAHAVDVSMLDLARFEQGRLIKEYNVV